MDGKYIPIRPPPPRQCFPWPLDDQLSLPISGMDRDDVIFWMLTAVAVRGARSLTWTCRIKFDLARIESATVVGIESRGFAIHVLVFFLPSEIWVLVSTF